MKTEISTTKEVKEEYEISEREIGSPKWYIVYNADERPMIPRYHDDAMEAMDAAKTLKKMYPGKEFQVKFIRKTITIETEETLVGMTK